MKTFIKEIGNNNLWLSVYLVILLVNLFLTMLFPLPQNDLRGGIDIVTRTATAVLGGYFLSQNFIKKKPELLTDKGEIMRNAFQTSLVASVGMFCLLSIMLVRYIKAIEISISSISLLRDSYLACVAFLMGTAKNKQKD